LLVKITPIIGICAVVILEAIAMYKGIDGFAFSGAIGAICLISGYWIKKIKG